VAVADHFIKLNQGTISSGQGKRRRGLRPCIAWLV